MNHQRKLRCLDSGFGYEKEGFAFLSDEEINCLNSFSMHGLQDLDNACLMDRVDRKFVIPRPSLSSLLEFTRSYYSVLEVAGARLSEYRNCYFDTKDYCYYNAHHRKQANRYKLRFRTYVESDTSYFEVKFKNNRGRTEKKRLLVTEKEKPSGVKARELSAACGCSDFSVVSAVQDSSYRRISLANESEGERLTIDLNLKYADNKTKKVYYLGEWIVVEVKQQNLNRHSAFYRWAKASEFRPCSFSKYCMGIYYTGPCYLKRNNFHNVHRNFYIVRERYDGLPKPTPS